MPLVATASVSGQYASLDQKVLCSAYSCFKDKAKGATTSDTSFRFLQRTEDAPPAPPGGLSLAGKAHVFLTHQRKFLKERQLIIEQARTDWKKRLQELDQVRTTP